MKTVLLVVVLLLGITTADGVSSLIRRRSASAPASLPSTVTVYMAALTNDGVSTGQPCSRSNVTALMWGCTAYCTTGSWQQHCTNPAIHPPPVPKPSGQSAWVYPFTSNQVTVAIDGSATYDGYTYNRYLRDVVAQETMPEAFAAKAVAAQAIAARTDAYHRGSAGPINNSAGYQVYVPFRYDSMKRNYAERAKLSILDLESGQEVMVDEQMLNLHGAITNIFAWSPDGSTLAFVNLVDGGLAGDAPQMVSELWRVDADGANLRQLWRSEQPYLGYTALRWLPNGKAILTTAAVESFSDLVQVTHGQSGQRADLFQGGKGLYLTETAPGVATILMQGAFGPGLMVDISTLVYQ